MTPRDPLPTATLIGLLGCAVFATLHPIPPLDIERPGSQVGRVVEATFIVGHVKVGDGWTRGDGWVSVPGSGTETTAYSTRIEWITFDEGSRTILPGDELSGRFRVDARGHAPSLVATGPPLVEPGPHPVPTSWRDLVARPERFVDRWIVVRGVDEGHRVVAPGGMMHCPWDHVDDARPDATHVMRPVRLAHAPAYHCERWSEGKA